MRFSDVIADIMFWGLKGHGRPVKYEVYESNIPSNVDSSKAPEPSNVATIYTAAKILSSAFSQIELQVLKDNFEFDKFRLYYEMKYRMSELMNNQVFWSTLEYHRNIYGNAFVDKRSGRNFIIHPALISDYDFKGENDGLRFKIAWSRAKDLIGNKYRVLRNSDEWIESKDLFHFKGMSVDGIFGLPPVSAVAHAMNITDKASNTISSFYDNRAMSPMALESTVATAASVKAMQEAMNVFKMKYQGTYNAGKVVQLPPNTKLTPLAIHFADAELIETLRFTREEILTMYGIPSFMWGSSSEMQFDIEQQSLNFKTFTLAPLTRVYEEELMYKLLTKRERMSGVTLRFNLDSLVETDLKTKSQAYSALVLNGIAAPNEASVKLGFPKREGEWYDSRYLQSQMISLENYGQDNPLMEATGQTQDTTSTEQDITQTKNEDEQNV